MKNIASALAKAQSEMGKALKQSDNPHFRSKYADLASVCDAVMPALNENGIAVVNQMDVTDGEPQVVTTFLHGETGDSLEVSVPVLLGKRDMQGLGSAITYARRYGLMMLAGIAPEDDDGNAAAANPPQRTWVQTITDELPPNTPPEGKAEAVCKALIAQFKQMPTPVQLNNNWDKIMGENKRPLDALAEKYPALWGTVQDAFQTRMEELSPNPDTMPEVA